MNACYKLLQEHLDRESNVNEGQDGTSTSYNNDNGEGHAEQDYDWEEVHRAQCEEQETYEKEMKRRAHEASIKRRKEMSEFQNRKKAAKKSSKKKKKKHKLYTDAGRDRAHEEFCRQAEAFERRREEDTSTSSPQDMNDIDDDHVRSRKKTSPQRKETKPQNLIMESNVDDDLALALKMGYFEMSIEIFLSRYAHKKGSFTAPLDVDGNTVAHYAIYFESFDFLECVCNYLYSEHTKQLKALFTYENKRGQSSLYYANFTKDKRIKKMIETKIQMAEDLIANKSSFRSHVNTARTCLMVIGAILMMAIAYIQVFDVLLALVCSWYFVTSKAYAFACIQTMKHFGWIPVMTVWAIGHFAFGVGFFYSVGIYTILSLSIVCCCGDGKRHE